MRLLVVDDDPKLRGFLTRGLRESGMSCESAPDGESAIEKLRSESFDLALLDVTLPGIQGWEVMETLKKEGIEVPVIWVTARDALDERIRGLEMGGDDYVIKPFAFAELLARIQAVARRHQMSTYRVGDLDVDLVHTSVRRAGEEISLTKIEWALLRELILRKGDPVSRPELLRVVWDLDFDPGTNLVDVHIRRLRLKIDASHSQKLIHTIRGSGYAIHE